MKKHILVLVLLALGWLSSPATAQFTLDEIAQREYWEEFLGTAKIVSARQLSRKKGITQPYVLLLEKDGITHKAIWKPIEGLHNGYTENWRWEIAAYELDKYLGLNMIPPTVERKHLNKRGSIQLWIKAKTGLKEWNGNKITWAENEALAESRSIFLQRAFDNLIANEDRHLGNYLCTEDGRILLIDHSRSFRTSKEYTSHLIFNQSHRDGNMTMRQLPISFIEKIRNLDAALLNDIAGHYLTEKERDAVLARKDLMLIEIDRMIEEYGPSDVLY